MRTDVFCTKQIIQAVEEMKANIEQLKQDIVDAKTRQDQAKADVKRIENDMNEFKNNKGGKLAELQVRQPSQKTWSHPIINLFGYRRPSQI